MATVDCTIPALPEHVRLDVAGERTEVAILCTGAIAIQEATPLRDTLQLLQEDRRRSIAVVDRANILVGVVHERALMRRSPPFPSLTVSEPKEESVESVMSTPASVHEAMSIRGALRRLAASHLRDVTVVASDGRPLGLFRDVDGLRWIGRARNGPIDAAVSCSDDRDHEEEGGRR